LLKDVFAITASMVPLAAAATDVGDDIIEVEGFIVASSFLCNNVIVIIDRSHRFMPIYFFLLFPYNEEFLLSYFIANFNFHIESKS